MFLKSNYELGQTMSYSNQILHDSWSNEEHYGTVERKMANAKSSVWFHKAVHSHPLPPF